MPISIPPLRLRLQDINDLVIYFLNKSVNEGLDKKNISDDAIEVLKKYHWPGNVRELENFVRRLLVLVPSKRIKKTDVEKNLNLFNKSALSIYNNFKKII